MKKLGERTAVVRCRQVDLMAVKECLDVARRNYTAQFQQEAPTLTLDQKDFLPPPPVNMGDEGSYW
jgi:V-type H+-transporting ATPase subunit E